MLRSKIHEVCMSFFGMHTSLLVYLWLPKTVNISDVFFWRKSSIAGLVLIVWWNQQKLPLFCDLKHKVEFFSNTHFYIVGQTCWHLVFDCQSSTDRGKYDPHTALPICEQFNGRLGCSFRVFKYAHLCISCFSPTHGAFSLWGAPGNEPPSFEVTCE